MSAPTPAGGTPPPLSVTDRLAATRTALANERTLLVAYVRTALALAAGGGALVQLPVSPALTAVGGALVPLGMLLLVVGLVRFRAARRTLGALERRDGGPVVPAR